MNTVPPFAFLTALVAFWIACEALLPAKKWFDETIASLLTITSSE
jgi:hypothetical protein